MIPQGLEYGSPAFSVLSRLKGIETDFSVRVLPVGCIAFSVLSRLKGIETDIADRHSREQISFQCAFPFEGN